MAKESLVKEHVDVVIVGAGPAGLTAALYASRANLKTVMIEQGLPGGEVNNTADVENYLGYPLISGPELAEKMYQSAMVFGVDHVMGQVTKIDIEGEAKLVYTSDKCFISKVLILATGCQHRKLGLDSEMRLNGKGVSYCAVCDGFFFRDKDLVVVGGGDSAVEEATYLTQFASKVTIIHRRDQLRAQKLLQDRAFNHPKIHFIWDSVVEEVVGDQAVEAVRIKSLNDQKDSLVPCQGVFIYIGLVPNTSLVTSLGICDEEGWIITNERMQTSIPGVFAVGDVRQNTLRQIATAVGDGSRAGHQAYLYLQEMDANK